MKLAAAVAALALLASLPSSADAACAATYTVNSGDALSLIAEKYPDTTQAAIASQNGISNPDKIQVGQVLNIPPCDGGSGGAGSCKAEYTVKSGDALSLIAEQYGTTTAAIASENGISNPDSIQVGQVLRIPPCGGSSPGPVPSPSPSPDPTAAPAPGDVSISADEFAKCLTACGYDGQPDSKRTDMLASIQRQGGSAVISTRRELAMFLAQLYRESIGLSTIKEIGGESASYAPYYGRGYIQLTNKDNYATASQALYGDDRLVTDPDQILNNDAVAWDVTTFYWKSRVHGLAGVAEGQFGATTKGINGGECSANPDRAQQRCDNYGKILPVLGLNEQPDCSGCL